MKKKKRRKFIPGYRCKCKHRHDWHQDGGYGECLSKKCECTKFRPNPDPDKDNTR